MSTPEIDFVITWVDGSDPLWQAQKKQFTKTSHADDSAIRYRSWELLRYWFRGVEAYAPWVRKIHFVTWGHLPPWLQTEHPKLHIVRHEDYLPAEWLPTFNSHTLELSMHKIPDLAEHFVYFNDDLFLLNPQKPENFFSGGLPCDSAVLSPAIVEAWQDVGFVALNNMGVINAHFSKKDVMHQNLGKWFSPRYGKQLLRTLCLSPWRHFPGFFNDHLPQPFLRTTFEHVWEAEAALLEQTSACRFRDYHNNVSPWLMRYWQFCEGHFVPASPKRGMDVTSLPMALVAQIISQQRTDMICFNDSEQIADFAAASKQMQSAFECILPTPCGFEK
ncbi:MAG: stealth family protein [Clostridia bacterium]